MSVTLAPAQRDRLIGLHVFTRAGFDAHSLIALSRAGGSVALSLPDASCSPLIISGGLIPTRLDSNQTPMYFHGGCPGLSPGDMVRSAKATGVPSVSSAAGDAYRRDRVYITASAAEARDYARLYISPSVIAALSRNGSFDLADLGGAVYEVQPLGPIEPDRDYVGTPGISWQTTEARVVRVVDERIMPFDENDKP